MKKRHIVLVGLPGAGKTTVGRLVAQRLGAPFVDLDQLIESREGNSVSAIFAEQGEAAFRAVERAVGEELLAGAPTVIAPGGGFFLDAGTRRRTLDVACAVYLETSPRIAAERLAGQSDRPLLEGGDMARRIGELLSQREAAYLEAPCRVTTDGRSAKDVADAVCELARAEAGW